MRFKNEYKISKNNPALDYFKMFYIHCLQESLLIKDLIYLPYHFCLKCILKPTSTILDVNEKVYSGKLTLYL